MDQKIEVRVCVCTLCSVMGGSDLQLLGGQVPPEWKPYVRITGSINLAECHGDGKTPTAAKPPFASVDGVCIQRADIPSVLLAIEARMKALNIHL